MDNIFLFWRDEIIRFDQEVSVLLAKKNTVRVPFGQNANVAIVGPPGCGKTFSNLLPNLLKSTNCSMVVDDKKGFLYETTHQYFKEKGYRVLKFDTIHFDNTCMHYNPFTSVSNKEDILRLVHMLLADTLEKRDPFWIVTARDLAACIIEIGLEMVKETGEILNFENFFYLLDGVGRIPEQQDAIERIIEDFEKEGKSFQAMQDYKNIKNCSDGTWKSIVVTLEGYMQQFHSPDIMKMTDRTSFDLTEMGKSKTIIYVISSDVDNSKYPLIQMFYHDLCYQLIDFADSMCVDNELKLPIHVRFFLDDFASGVQMNQFKNIIANCRSRNISYMICFQSIAQLNALYGDFSDSILDCMEFQVYYPTTNLNTIRYMSEAADISKRKVMEMQQDEICVLQRCKRAEIQKRIDVIEMEEYKTAINLKWKKAM